MWGPKREQYLSKMHDCTSFNTVSKFLASKPHQFTNSSFPV